MNAKVLAAVGQLLVRVAGVDVVVVTSIGGGGGQGIATKHVGRTKMEFTIKTYIQQEREKMLRLAKKNLIIQKLMFDKKKL